VQAVVGGARGKQDPTTTVTWADNILKNFCSSKVKITSDHVTRVMVTCSVVYNHAINHNCNWPEYRWVPLGSSGNHCWFTPCKWHSKVTRS